MVAFSISCANLSKFPPAIFRIRGACPRPVEKPNFHLLWLSSNARYIGLEFVKVR
jgi:hypothetical protein